MYPDVLVATNSSLVFVRNGEVEKISECPPLSEDEPGAYFGLTYSQNRIYVGSRAGNVDVYDKDMNIVGRMLRPRLKFTHQLLYHNDSLYCVNTGRDEIVTYDKGCGLETIYGLTSAPASDRNEDTQHFNCLWWDGSLGVFWLSQAIKGEPGYINHVSPEFQIIKTMTVGKMPHTVYHEGDRVYVCESRDFMLTEYSWPSFEKIRSFSEDCNWLRGLATTPDFFVVGISGYSDNRENRTWSESWIYYLNRDLTLNKRVFLGNLGAIGDVRVVNQRDLSHNEYTFTM